jgi:hypothetical protein
MESYEIVIEYTDHDKFKAGIHDIHTQLQHIQSQIIELKKKQRLTH